MAVENVFKDVASLHQRLFVHKPVLQGHTTFFVKEFEERRGDREKGRLEKTRDNVVAVGTSILPALRSTLEDCVTEINAKVTLATERCQTIAEMENQQDSEYLKNQRARREEDWRNFMARQCEKSAEVDQEHLNQVSALVKHYADLEEKIRGNGSAGM